MCEFPTVAWPTFLGGIFFPSRDDGCDDNELFSSIKEILQYTRNCSVVVQLKFVLQLFKVINVRPTDQSILLQDERYKHVSYIYNNIYINLIRSRNLEYCMHIYMTKKNESNGKFLKAKRLRKTLCPPSRVFAKTLE